jgi:hypothetical protein
MNQSPLFESDVNQENLGFIAKLKIPALIIVILMLVLTLVFYILNFNGIYNPTDLLFSLNLIFIFIPALVIAYISSRAFLRSGNWPLLWLGVGALIYGFSKLIGGYLINRVPINIEITFFNVTVLLAAILFFLGAFFLINRVSDQENKKSRLSILLQVYIGSFVLTFFLSIVSILGYLPTFFVEGIGGTPIRQIIIGISIILFLLAGLINLKMYRNSKKLMIYWYGLGLILVSIGLLGAFTQDTFGSPLFWIGRISQLLGGIYLTIVAFIIFKTAQTQKISPDEALISFFSAKKSYIAELLKCHRSHHNNGL